MLRHAKRFFGFLALGAFLSTLVAWICVYTASRYFGVTNYYHNPAHADPAVIEIVRGVGCETVSGIGRPGTFLSRRANEVKVYPESIWWPSEAVTFDQSFFALRSGWPCRSLLAWRTVESFEVAGELVFENVDHAAASFQYLKRARPFDSALILPLKPQWPGFVFNTVFYAAVCYGVMRLVRFTLKSKRSQKGLCNECGYLTGLSSRCPECGVFLSAAYSES